MLLPLKSSDGIGHINETPHTIVVVIVSRGHDNIYFKYCIVALYFILHDLRFLSTWLGSLINAFYLPQGPRNIDLRCLLDAS